MKEMKMKRILLLLTGAVLLFPSCVYGQGIDVGRAAAIELASSQAKKTIEAQMKMQGLETAGHIWTKEEIEATTEFQRQFNDYLDSFHNILTIAAEIYGVYYEVTKTSKHVKNLAEVVSSSPSNVLAVAFSTRRNVVYRNLIKSSLDIFMDIRKVCFEKSKMTEQEKNKVISGIRPKLRKINHQLAQLTLALRYTSFLDVWNEITERAYMINPATKHDIITRCRREWWNNAKSVR